MKTFPQFGKSVDVCVAGEAGMVVDIGGTPVCRVCRNLILAVLSPLLRS